VIVPSFTYRVDTFGGVQGHDQEGKPTNSAHVFVDGVQCPQTWLGHFTRPERDLLRVAAAVLDLDRLSRRRPLNTKGLKREQFWRRSINAMIAVEDPSRWSAVAGDLHALLSFLSDDAWTLMFEQAEPFREQQLLFAPDLDDSAEIALFSGGLDSSVGLRARQLQSGGSFVAVSAAGTEVRHRAQDTALGALRDLGVRVTAVSIAHQLRSEVKLPRGALEATQRTRGFFFLSIGAAVASRLGNPKFHVYETGIGCLNVPTSPAQIASQATRAMHPLTLVRFNNLVAKVLDRPPQVLVPFFFMTKGELCALVRDDLPALAQKCSSCDEGDGHKLDPMVHCGLCTSCMFRRIAIVSAGVPDPTRYRDTPSRRHNSYEVSAFEYHAADLSHIATIEDLTDLDPNVRFAFNAPTGGEISLDVARSQTVEMYRGDSALLNGRTSQTSTPSRAPRKGDKS
jgi:7-cyano-7-deazaguanine synthase in queuosine biosynthesis